MKIAIVSDIHGNLPALEAVVNDLEEVGPDLVIHGGDLALNGPQPAECIDVVRELGWPGTMGNTDEVLWTSAGVPEPMLPVFDRLAPATAELVGDERVQWLQGVPREWRHGDTIALVHATPTSLWTAIPADADDAALQNTFGPLGTPLAVYCHIHVPFVRALPGLTVANTGSVGMPFDGDPRSSYLVIEDSRPSIRRVEYDIDREVANLMASGYPFAEILARARQEGRSPQWR